MPGAPPRTELLRLPLGRRAPKGRPYASIAIAALLVGSAVAVAVGPWASWARALAGVGLVAAAAVTSALGRRRQTPPRGWLVVDGRGIHRVDRGRAVSLVGWGEAFGVTVLASADRAALLLAVTTPRAVRYLSARVRDAEDAAVASTLLERATTAAASDLRGGDDPSLSAADAERLVEVLGRVAPAALDSLYLSDTAGEEIVLGPRELRVGAKRIDLSAPLEWRASLFQELGPHVAVLCQATWVRQGDVELAFVAPAPGDEGWTNETAAAVRAAGEGAVVRRAVMRDFRLSRAASVDPPPRDARHAIDRVFMVPLRRALDRAPGASRIAGPARAKVASHPT